MVGKFGLAESAPLVCIGLMSGTSLDGIDIALLETDGAERIRRGAARSCPYAPERRRRLRALLDAIAAAPDAPPPEWRELERDITLDHAAAVSSFLREEGLQAGEVDLIGFHGQTVSHRPERGETWQLGDAALLAQRTGVDVIYDFRSADMRAGGQGAPLAPLYHAALTAARGEKRVVGVVNLGGIANLTWIAPGEAARAFDVAPCNGLLNDWAGRHGVGDMDRDGALARRGRVCEETLAGLLRHPFLRRRPPKSLDRLDVSLEGVAHLAPADGAATLVAFVAEALAAAVAHVPAAPEVWLLCGGGRHNRVVREALERRLPGACFVCEEWGWAGDSLEAEAFAWLAARSRRGLPLSLPSTTGAARAVCGGREVGAGGS